MASNPDLLPPTMPYALPPHTVVSEPSGDSLLGPWSYLVASNFLNSEGFLVGVKHLLVPKRDKR